MYQGVRAVEKSPLASAQVQTGANQVQRGNVRLLSWEPVVGSSSASFIFLEAGSPEAPRGHVTSDYRIHTSLTVISWLESLSLCIQGFAGSYPWHQMPAVGRELGEKSDVWRKRWVVLATVAILAVQFGALQNLLLVRYSSSRCCSGSSSCSRHRLVVLTAACSSIVVVVAEAEQ